MSRKRNILRIVFLAIIMLSLFCGNALCEEVGRYQLFQGQYRFINIKGEQYWNKALFKIDTVTGEVWIGSQDQYRDPKTGKAFQIRNWEPFEQELPIPENIIQE